MPGRTSPGRCQQSSDARVAMAAPEARDARVRVSHPGESRAPGISEHRHDLIRGCAGAILAAAQRTVSFTSPARPHLIPPVSNPQLQRRPQQLAHGRPANERQTTAPNCPIRSSRPMWKSNGRTVGATDARHPTALITESHCVAMAPSEWRIWAGVISRRSCLSRLESRVAGGSVRPQRLVSVMHHSFRS